MIKRLALLTLLATPVLAHAQATADEAVAAKAPAVPLVTYDITGTFPANMPVSRMTAPDAAFVIEISFEQTVPAITYETFAFSANAVAGSYCFEGHVYKATSGSYSVYAHAPNAHTLTLGTSVGTVSFYTWGVNPNPSVDLPFQIHWVTATPENPNPMGSVTFLPGDVGAPTLPWPLTFTNVHGQSIASPVKITDVVGRLVLPKPVPLATR